MRMIGQGENTDGRQNPQLSLLRKVDPSACFLFRAPRAAPAAQ